MTPETISTIADATFWIGAGMGIGSLALLFVSGAAIQNRRYDEDLAENNEPDAADRPFELLFCPKPDITAHELASVVRMPVDGGSPVSDAGFFVDRDDLPIVQARLGDAYRHFAIVGEK